jgi:iron complex outermembrane receptor protein
MKSTLSRRQSRKTQRNRRAAAALIGTGTTLLAPLAFAQTVDEVVVSATRRDTSVQDIPYNISAISSETLEQNHVSSLSDLSQSITGMSFVDAGPTSRSNFVLRGINANATDTPSRNTVAPVSMYMGETPLFLPLQVSDIERVEVLRGPQGTLYGSGSLAGTIRFIPKKPDLGSLSVSLTGDVAGVEATNQYNRGISGTVNVPITDSMAFRVDAGWQHYAGFIDENFIVKLDAPGTAKNSPVGIPTAADPNDILSGLVFNPRQNANDSDIDHVRASYLFKPDEKFSTLLTYYHQDTRSHGAQAHSPGFSGSVDTAPEDNIYYSPSYPVLFPTGGTIFPQNKNYDANNSFLLMDNRKTDLVSADLDYDFGFASLASSTSYYRDRGDSVADNTGLLSLYADFYGFIPRMVDYQTNTDDTKGFVEELRLVSAPGRKLDYVVGLFYQHLKDDTTEMQWIPGQTFFGGFVDYPGPNADTLGDVNVIGSSHTDFKDRAIFGELTLHVTDRWQITGGTRKFKQDFSLDNSTAFPFCGIGCSNIDDQLGTTLVDKSYSVNKEIYKLNSSYKLSDTLNVYANYAEGFRRGGSTGIPISGPFAGNPALLIYKPDETRNYEVGAKGSFAGVTYSAAVFYINWDSFQVDQNAASSGFPIAVNGATAHSKGIELELSGALARAFTYRLGYSYAKAQVAADFQVMDLENSLDGPVPVAIIDAKKGDPLPNSPQSTATLALDYAHPAPAFLTGWDVRWHLNGSYRSATLSQLVSATPGNPPPFRIDGFSVWGASVNLANAHGLETSLYVENLFNELAETGGSDRGSVGLRAEQFYIGRPRTVGLQMRWAWKP